MEAMRAHFQREPNSEWTTYNSSMERPLLNSKRFLEKMQSVNGHGAEPVSDSGQGENAQQESAGAAAAGEDK